MVSIYLRNKTINPSAFYRIFQYLNDIDADVIVRNLNSDMLYNLSLNSSSKLVRKISQVFLYIEMNFKFMIWSHEDIKKGNTIFVQREIIPKYCLPFVQQRLIDLYTSCRTIWDIDDNILAGNEITKYEYDTLLENASDIIVTSSHLSKLIKEKTKARIYELPTTDCTIYKHIDSNTIEERLSIYDDMVKLVWLGTSGNINEVERILPYIENVADKLEKKVVLTIISGVDPHLESECMDIKFVRWSRDAVINEFQSSHIGIMPLKDNEFNAGKGGFKLIQYLSAAIPIIGSAVGVNVDIINDSVGKLIYEDEEWIKAIYELSADKILYSNMSQAALSLWKRDYSSEIVANKLNKIINAEDK